MNNHYSLLAEECFFECFNFVQTLSMNTFKMFSSFPLMKATVLAKTSGFQIFRFYAQFLPRVTLLCLYESTWLQVHFENYYP